MLRPGPKKILIATLSLIVFVNIVAVDFYVINQKHLPGVLGYSSPNPPTSPATVLENPVGSGGAFSLPSGTPSILGASTNTTTTWRSIPSDVNINGVLNISGAAGGAIDSGSRICLTSSGGCGTAIEENWGINLEGDNLHPIRIYNSSLLVGGSYSGGTNYGFGNLIVSGGTTNPPAPAKVKNGFIYGNFDCRTVTNQSTNAPTYPSTASCAADEFLLTGGGQCSQDGTDLGDGAGIITNGDRGFLHTNYPNYEARSWIADCYDGTNQRDVKSKAWAVCCTK